MSNAKILETLRDQPHFQMLAVEILERLAEGCRWIEYRSEDSVFCEGERARGFHIIGRGAVRLFRLDGEGREHVVHRLGPGASFAEAALLNFGVYPVNAVAAATPTEILEVGGETLLRLFREEERFAPAMVGSLCMRLLFLVERVEDLSQSSAGARLARWLVRQPARAGKHGPELELGFAKRELAGLLAMTPETLSRLLRRWQESGLIRSEGGRVVLLATEALLELADGGQESTRRP